MSLRYPKTLLISVKKLNNVAEESKEGPVEMEWDVNDDNNQELDDNGQIKIF